MLAVLILSIYLFHNNAVILPILTGIILFTLTTEFLINRIKIRSGKILKIGRNKNEIWISALFFTIGFIMILVRIFFKNHSNWNGLDGNFFLGFILISKSILEYDNSIMIVKEKTIQFNEFLNVGEYKIAKIEKVVIENNNVRSELKGKVIELTVDDRNFKFDTKIV